MVKPYKRGLFSPITRKALSSYRRLSFSFSRDKMLPIWQNSSLPFLEEFRNYFSLSRFRLLFLFRQSWRAAGQFQDRPTNVDEEIRFAVFHLFLAQRNPLLRRRILVGQRLWRSLGHHHIHGTYSDRTGHLCHRSYGQRVLANDDRKIRFRVSFSRVKNLRKGDQKNIYGTFCSFVGQYRGGIIGGRPEQLRRTLVQGKGTEHGIRTAIELCSRGIYGQLFGNGTNLQLRISVLYRAGMHRRSSIPRCYHLRRLYDMRLHFGSNG